MAQSEKDSPGAASHGYSRPSPMTGDARRAGPTSPGDPMSSVIPRAFALLLTAPLATVPAEAQVRTRVPVREIVRPVSTPTTTTTKTTPTTTETADPRRARYRVVLAGGRVNNPTFDNPLNLDGWGDEVYFTADVQLFDKVSGSISPFAKLFDRKKICGELGQYT